MLERLVIFVEEYSMEVALERLLPRILGETDYQIIKFQCKDQLLKELPCRLKGYAAWIPENWAILVLVDRDDDDCQMLKQKLEQYAQNVGFATKTTAAPGQRFIVTNRIVVEELESWYFGDWNAVCAAYPKVPATIPQKMPYRNPDTILGGTWEALERILQGAGYFAGGLRKNECAREITQYMDVNQNRSPSFNQFYRAILSMLEGGIA